MAKPPNSEIRIWKVSDRRGQRGYKRRPWEARWSVDGERFRRGYATRTEADHFRSRLLQAQREGDRFDRATGEPESWNRPGDVRIHVWVRRWLDEQWSDWSPRSRASAVESISRLIPLAVQAKADPPDQLRPYLKKNLAGLAEVDDGLEAWMDRWCLPLNRLDAGILADIDRRLSLGVSGQRLALSTSSRYRNNARACIRRAVDLELIPRDPWPPAPRGASKRKSRRGSRVDVRQLPDPATMRQALEAVITHQPASHRYYVMNSVLYYAGLRPSECVMLRRGRVKLPLSGWGEIEVVEADIDYDEPGEPKTGNRRVPIPPVLVEVLVNWIESGDYRSDDLLFRTRNGNRPTPSNWLRSWHRALRSIGLEPLRLYDCRHAAATTWLAAGVPLGEVARRLGNSVEVLLSTYVGALQDDDLLANERIEAILSGSR